MRSAKSLAAALVCAAALAGVAWAGDGVSSGGGLLIRGEAGIDDSWWYSPEDSSSTNDPLGPYEAWIDDSFVLTESVSSGGDPLGGGEAGIDDSYDPAGSPPQDAGGTSMPEPATLCLLAIGGLALLRRGRK